MESWYQTREGCSVQHGAKVIPPGKKIFLADELADLHNSIGDQVEKTEPPTKLEEVGVKAEWDAYQAEQGGLGGSPHEPLLQEEQIKAKTEAKVTAATKELKK